MRRFFDLGLPVTASIIAVGTVVWCVTNAPALVAVAPCALTLPV